MIIYTLPLSSYGNKVVLVLAAKRIDCELRPPPGGLYSETYRAIVPTGQIPALVDGDLQITESEVISEYLNEVYPDPPLLPADPKERARSRFFSRFHDIRLEPHVRNLFWQVPLKKRDLAVVDHNLDIINARLAELGRLATPAPYLVGPRLTLADCAYPSTLMYLDLILGAMGREAVYPEVIVAWRQTLAADPLVRSVMEPHAKAGAEWLAAKTAEGSERSAIHGAG